MNLYVERSLLTLPKAYFLISSQSLLSALLSHNESVVLIDASAKGAQRKALLGVQERWAVMQSMDAMVRERDVTIAEQNKCLKSALR